MKLFSKPNKFGDSTKRFGTDDGASGGCQKAFGVIWAAFVKEVGDDQLQDGVTEKLKALVALFDSLFVQTTSMSQCGSQQRLIPEGIVDSFLEVVVVTWIHWCLVDW